MPETATVATAERSLMDQAFTRAAGAERIEGNRVRLLRDAAENYPAWLDAIGTARRTVDLEMYYVRDDGAGRRLADALAERARAGVAVRLLYDWVGGLGKASRAFWRYLRESGVEVRCFNPPQAPRPMGWIRRNHRKSLVIDGRLGFVTGLCVGDEWVGDPSRGVPQWRDTGIEVEGPAVADIERSFLGVWSRAGSPVPAGERTGDPPGRAGDVTMRVIASEPNRTELLLLDQLVASAARETLWIADAYYAGVPSHVQALRAAALDGVDVRMLLPGATDLPLVRAVSRAGYRPLLESGVRIFEWNGPMLHSKTAVADGRWARVGSSNLNVASWLANYELDAVIEDRTFAEEMERQYERDLEGSTEVILGERRVRRVIRGRERGRAGRAALVGIRLRNVLSAAVTSHRAVLAQEAGILAAAGFVALGAAVAALVWPWLVAVPLAVIGGWIGITLVARAWRLRRDHGKR